MPMIFQILPPSSKFSLNAFSFLTLTYAEGNKIEIKIGEGNKIITIFITAENACFPVCYPA